MQSKVDLAGRLLQKLQAWVEALRRPQPEVLAVLEPQRLLGRELLEAPRSLLQKESVPHLQQLQLLLSETEYFPGLLQEWFHS